MGLSATYLAVSPPAFVVAWRPRSGGGLQQDTGFDAIEDLDLFADRVLVLAARRGARGEYAPDGGIAWSGSVKQGLADTKPILFDRSGPGARNFAACTAFEMGVVRFLADGSFVIAPGVQPGVNLYEPGGRLVRAWDTGALGIDSDCGSITAEQKRRLGAQPEPRFAWLNQRRTIDEVLPLPDGPALVVRSVKDGRAVWDLVRLRRDGATSTQPLPVPSGNPFGHLRGDVRGSRVVLVFFDAGRHLTTFAPSRLLEIAVS